MRISKCFFWLLLVLCPLAVVLPITGPTDAADNDTTIAAPTRLSSVATTSADSSPTTDSEIMEALETFDSSIDDPEYQKAYDNYQASLGTGGVLQALSTRTNPYTGLTYTHSHSKTAYIYNGVDVSKWQAKIDWKKVKADGIDFAFIRCGYTPEGSFSLHTDANFTTNIKNAYAAGIKVGVYYFSQAITREEAEEEAKHVVKLISPYKKMITMPVAMDYERSAARKSRNLKVRKADTTKFAQTFCSVVDAAGYDASYYSSASQLTDYFSQSALRHYTCWMAHLIAKPNYTGTYDFWQYSWSGDVNGIPTDVDCDFWYSNQKLSATSVSRSALTSSNTAVNLSYTTVPYSGSTHKPTPTVTYKGAVLKGGSDYTVVYSNNKEPGTATVKITGCGKYTGGLSKTFTISALTTPYVTKEKTYYRTGCGTGYTSKGSIPKEHSVDVVYGWYKTAKGQKWFKVKIGNTYYYMYGPNLTQEVLTKYTATTTFRYRTGAGTSYTTKGSFAKGGTVQVIKGWSKTVSGEKWYKIKAGSSYYYATSRYLKSQESLGIYTVNSKVNVRTGAGTNYTRKASLYTGTPVAVVSGVSKTVSKEKWHHVKIGTSYYYIMASYLSKK